MIIKASLTACLFLLSQISVAQQWDLSAKEKKEYRKVLDLAYTNVKPVNQSTYQEAYIQSYGEALELLLTENPEFYQDFESRAENRITQFEKDQSASALFLKAEIRLQWAFVHLKFGNELDAAWDLRQAYLLTKQCKKKHPNFKPINKTSGILNVLVGSVPEKYDWILSLLRMEGNVAKGIEELTSVQNSNSIFSIEAMLLKSLVEGYVFQQPAEGIQHISNLLEKETTPSLAMLLATSLYVKNSQSEKALEYIQQLEQRGLPLNMAFIHYLKGEVYLHKGEYPEAIAAYEHFIKKFEGENHIKDAHYKTGLCYWLNNTDEKADYYFSKAETVGRSETEADKYAARSLQTRESRNRKLTKIRYFTDGGYYDQASAVIQTVSPSDLKSKKDSVEFYYRNARLLHKMGNPEASIEFYKKTILRSDDLQTYFAPNSCLQLGYIYEDKNDPKNATLYFKKALSYKKHEYKNSIDSKARSALDQLKDRK